MPRGVYGRKRESAVAPRGYRMSGPAEKYERLSITAERAGALRESLYFRSKSAEYHAEDKHHREAAQSYRAAAATCDRLADKHDAAAEELERSEGGDKCGGRTKPT